MADWQGIKTEAKEIFLADIAKVLTVVHDVLNFLSIEFYSSSLAICASLKMYLPYHSLFLVDSDKRAKNKKKNQI